MAKEWPPYEALLSEPGPPAWFSIWWFLWILSSIAGNISFRLSFAEKVPEDTATVISIVASALSIMAAVFAYLVVAGIDKRQEETSAKLKLGKEPLPPPPNPPMWRSSEA